MIKRSGPCRTRRRLRGGLALAAVAAGGALAGEASAGDLGVALEDALTDPSPSHFYANLGPGVLLFDAGATVKEHGVALPGATIKLDPNTTLISEVGYRDIQTTPCIAPWKISIHLGIRRVGRNRPWDVATGFLRHHGVQAQPRK
jgi:hypothetical protein